MFAESQKAIALNSVSKIYSGKVPYRAVDALSFDVEQGDALAFLGPNGAGKSTTIKILCGILSPSAGTSHILGFKSGSKEAAQYLGLVFGTRSQLWMHMTVAQSLEMLAEIYRIAGTQKKQRIAELAELFEISHLLSKRARSLSLGERMRCEIVGALIHRPRVLLADEPTIGLDIVAKNELRSLLLRWQREEKTTLLLTSHDVSDVEALCKRCILIDKGQKKYDGNLESLKGELTGIRRIKVTLEHAAVPFEPTSNFVTIKDKEEYVHNFEVDTRKSDFSKNLGQLIAHYQDAIADVGIECVPLEEVLGNMFKSEPRGMTT